MDMLNMTTEYRQNILKFIKPILDDKSYIWVGNLMSSINKAIVKDKGEFFISHALVMYKNFIPFMQRYCLEITPTAILYSLYTCAVELGLKKIGDEVESYQQFLQDIDETDYSNCDEETLKRFDMLMAMKLIAGEEKLFACGLYTLETMEFL